MGGSHDDVQRFLFWTAVTSGAAGHTYGAQGIWGMSSRDEPFQGTTSSWGDGFWQDVMHLPGSCHLALGRQFLERYPWWRFQPRPEPEAAAAGRLSAFGAGIPGQVAVFYLAGNGMGPDLMGVQGTRIRIEPGAHYRAHYFDPRTGNEVRHFQTRGPVQVHLDAVEPDADGTWPVPPKPTMADWVLVLEDPDKLGR